MKRRAHNPKMSLNKLTPLKYVRQAIRQLDKGEPDKAIAAIRKCDKLRKSWENRRYLNQAADEAECGDPSRAVTLLDICRNNLES